MVSFSFCSTPKGGEIELEPLNHKQTKMTIHVKPLIDIIMDPPDEAKFNFSIYHSDGEAIYETIGWVPDDLDHQSETSVAYWAILWALRSCRKVIPYWGPPDHKGWTINIVTDVELCVTTLAICQILAGRDVKKFLGFKPSNLDLILEILKEIKQRPNDRIKVTLGKFKAPLYAGLTAGWAPRIDRETKTTNLGPPPTSKHTRQAGPGTTTSKKDGSSSSCPSNRGGGTAGANSTAPNTTSASTDGSGTSRPTTGRPLTIDTDSVRLRPEGGAECKTS